MKKLTLNKKEFKENFVVPALKLGEDKFSLNCDLNNIKTCIQKKPEVIFINSIAPIESDYEGTLNFRSLQKLDRLISLVPGETVTFNIKDNFVLCDAGSFVYKMIMDNDMIARSIDLDKLNAVPLPFSFTLSSDEYKNLKTLSRLADNEYKVYFSGNGEKLVAMLSDKNKSYSSDLTMDLSATTNLNTEIILRNTFLELISLQKNTDLVCKTDGSKLFVVEHGNQKYIFTAILK